MTYEYNHIGPGREALTEVTKAPIEPGNRDKRNIVIVGMAALTDADGAAVLSHAMKFAEDYNAGLLILHTAAARVGAMDVGAVTEGGIDACLDGAEVVWSLGADGAEVPEDGFVIYQGSHGDTGAHRADVILPAAAWTEENGLFVNTEGRPQLAQRAGFAPGEAKENWAILRAMSAVLGATQPWDTLAGLRRAMVAAAPHLAAIDTVPANDWTRVPLGKPGKGDFGVAVTDFYLTNPIARASALMGELSRIAAARTDQIAAE